jgi:purine-cytosine permease-like protein
MKPKTAYIVNIVLLIAGVLMLVGGYLFLKDEFNLFQQIVAWILPVSPAISIINYLQVKREQDVEVRNEELQETDSDHGTMK